MLKPYRYKYISVLLLSMINVFFVATVNANSMVKTIEEVKQKLGADVGVSVYDVSSDDLWHYNGDTRFPLMSTFKTLACAKLLADIHNGEQSFDTSVVIKKESLVTWSPVTEKHVGESFSLRQACSAAMIMSDNTAANIVLKGINGPTALTQFMRSIGDKITRLDRIEPYLGEALDGDVRDTTTPNAMVKSLRELLFGNTLPAASKTQLKQWMTDNKVSDSLLRSVLPIGWLIADRSGAGGYGSRGITAVVWSEQRSPLIVAIYLTQTDASFAQRNKAIAQIGKEIFTFYR
ncbi:class A beta-lactamase [Thalassotalea sp. 42_200_T64]|nr:class A beta-lactamase [Thalassotalea sp. 42_200_T64]